MCTLYLYARKSSLGNDHKKRRAFLKFASTFPLHVPGVSTSYAANVLPKSENILTPREALDRLMAGNKRFSNGLVIRNDSFKTIPTSLRVGQNPYACILSCADSRVSPELCFDEGQGDLFVTRLAGNYVSTDVLASLEYGALILKSPLIMVLGHTECGAINAAIKAEKNNIDFPGHIQVIASRLDMAVRLAKRKDGILAYEAVRENVRLNVEDLSKSTPIIRRLIEDGRLSVVGGIYDLNTGKVGLVA